MNFKRFALGCIIGIAVSFLFARAVSAQGFTEEYPDPCVGAMAASPLCNLDPDPLHCSWYWTPLCDQPGRPSYPHPCVYAGTCGPHGDTFPEPPTNPQYPRIEDAPGQWCLFTALCGQRPERVDPLPATVVVVEFTDGERFFLTAFADEQTALKSAGAWHPTGLTFRAWASSHQRLAPVCRFWLGSSHLFTANAAECRNVWTANANAYEGVAFYVAQASLMGGCAATERRVYRLADGARYRFTADAALRDALIAAGWDDEGVAYCAAR